MTTPAEWSGGSSRDTDETIGIAGDEVTIFFVTVGSEALGSDQVFVASRDVECG